MNNVYETKDFLKEDTQWDKYAAFLLISVGWQAVTVSYQ